MLKPKRIPLSYSVHVNVTETEATRIIAAANGEYGNISGFCRRVLLAHLDERDSTMGVRTCPEKSGQ